MRNQHFLWLVILLTVLFPSCVKEDLPVSGNQSVITEAHRVFDKEVSRRFSRQRDKASTPRSRYNKTVLWHQAAIVKFRGLEAVSIPVKYDQPFYVRSNIDSNRFYNSNDITRLLAYTKGQGQFHFELLTAFPDTSYNGKKFTGIIHVEDWFSNAGAGYKISKNEKVRLKDSLPSSGNKQSESRNTTVVTYYIEGFNYSVDNPGGDHWTEVIGRDVFYGDNSGGSYRDGVYDDVPYDDIYLPGNDQTAGIEPEPLFVIPSPDKPIGNIIDYLKCFTKTNRTDNTYEITVCVSQPAPEARDAWNIQKPPPGQFNPVYVGHAFLVLKQSNITETIIRNVGFYPKNNSTPFSPTAPGLLNDDSGRKFNVALSVTMTSDEFFQVLKFLQIINIPGYNYNLNTNNCTTFAISAMEAANIALPKTIGKWVNGQGLNPGDLGEDLRKMPVTSKMKKIFNSFSNSNNGFCK